MINSVIHHIGLGLQEPEKAEQFFDDLLVEFLCMTKERTHEAIAGWKGRGSRIYLRKAESGSPPGALQHIAFTARSRDEVERFAVWARDRNIEITDGPEECPEYSGDYYAVFFRGPENTRFEIVSLTEADNATPL